MNEKYCVQLTFHTCIAFYLCFQEVQIFRVLVLGEEERGQSQYQVLCFATQLSKNDFISADAMSKLRQVNIALSYIYFKIVFNSSLCYVSLHCISLLLFVA